MNNKRPASITSLKNWSEKILTDSSRGEKRLRYFMENHNIKDYIQFYLELLPFLEELTADDPELFQPLVLKYKENTKVLIDATQENDLAEWLANIFFNLPMFSRSADDLISAIKEIRANIENMEYTLSLNN